MSDREEARYQENGFQLAVYRNRRADPYTTCDACGRAMFHVASILDQWAENYAALIHFYYCKHCASITQETVREGRDGSTSRRAVFQQAPHELIVEILATARQQNGRNVTLMTINRRWWSPYRYPLIVGERLTEEALQALADIPEIERLKDAQAPAAIPMQRYTPLQKDSRNPFTSRRRTAQEISDEEALDEELDNAVSTQAAVEDEAVQLPSTDEE